MAYQLKLKFENDRNAVTFLTEEEIKAISYSSLVERIKYTLPSRYRQEPFRLQYLDDEKCFVDLSKDQNCIMDMLRCANIVENADFRRITIKVDITNSPMPLSPPSRPVGKRSTTTLLSPSSLPARKEKVTKESSSSTGIRRRLSASFTNSPQLQSQVKMLNESTSLFKSPLEKYIDHQQEKLDTLKQKELQLSGWIKEYSELKSTGSVQRRANGPMCGNCHRRENHNRLNCPYPECETFFHCGAIDKHAAEKATLKDLEKQRKDVAKERESLENELKLKQKSISSIQHRFIYKVKKNLIDSDPSKYLSTSVDGGYVENWFQLNKDAKKLERICKGRVPATEEIQSILSGPDESVNPLVREQKKTSVRNPFRRMWEESGVQWPSTNMSATRSVPWPASSTEGGFLASLQSPEICDDYILALGIHESLNTADDQHCTSTNSTCTSTFQNDANACLQNSLASSTAPDDQTNNTDTSEGQLSGLDVLLEACKEVQGEEH